MMKHFIRLLLACALLAPLLGWTQAYPSKPVRIIIGFAPGATPVVFARLIAQKVSEGWGTQVVVENRPGATGNLNAMRSASSPPTAAWMERQHALPLASCASLALLDGRSLNAASSFSPETKSSSRRSKNWPSA